MDIDKEIAKKIWTDARSKFDKIPHRVDTDFELYWTQQQELLKNCSMPVVVGQSEQLPQKPNYCLEVSDKPCTRNNECIWCR